MSTYTITISDDNGTVSVSMAGDASKKSTPFLVATELMHLVPDAIKNMMRAANASGYCLCGKCEAKRAEAQAEANQPQTTLH